MVEWGVRLGDQVLLKPSLPEGKPEWVLQKLIWSNPLVASGSFANWAGKGSRDFPLGGRFKQRTLVNIPLESSQTEQTCVTCASHSHDCEEPLNIQPDTPKADDSVNACCVVTLDNKR